LWLFHAINGWSGNWALDWVALFAERNNLMKGAVVMAAYWGLWFVAGSRQSTRGKIVCALAGAVVSLIVARVLASALPFRVRPLYQADIGFLSPHRPDFARAMQLEAWSSFPSDHAALFFALATGLWLCSRTIGSIALAFAAVWVCLVRIYLGIHFPFDVVVGAMIGVSCGVFFGGFSGHRITAEILRIEYQHPAWFYAAMFLITFEFATLFDDVRQLMHGSSAALHAVGFQSVGLIAALAVGVACLVVLLGGFGFVLYRRRIRRA
jgi:undecaprenyl-diphosphatase